MQKSLEIHNLFLAILGNNMHPCNRNDKKKGCNYDKDLLDWLWYLARLSIKECLYSKMYGFSIQ
jgi:hypothetical protein